MIGLIWAEAANGVIGAGGGIPWRLPEDQVHFRECTQGAAVVMGRRTWDSLPERFRPLPGRRNIVLTRRAGWQAPGAEVAASLEEALALPDGDVWVIGGGEVYRSALPFADRVVRTELEESFEGDALAPALGEAWQVASRRPGSGWLVSRTGLRYRISTLICAVS